MNVLKKIEGNDFHLKNANLCQTWSIFWTVIQDRLKMTLLFWAKHHFWKIQEVSELYFDPVRNGKQSSELQAYKTPSPPPQPFSG